LWITNKKTPHAVVICKYYLQVHYSPMNRRQRELAEKEELARLYPTTPNSELARRFNTTVQGIKNRARRYGLKKATNGGRVIINPDTTEEQTMTDKIGVESRQSDLVIINWTTKTIITDLGEFGTFTCSFTTHGAIQRAYVHGYEGKGETASEVATRFDFPHAKAVYLYAKAHGFTKASLGQTDIEFEMGLTPEQAAEENIQAQKRRAMKLTERRKWQEIQKDADKWNHFKSTVFYPVKDWVEANLPAYRPPKYQPRKKSKQFAAVVGLSDWHYMKYAYDHNGETTYNRTKARKALADANSSLIDQMVAYGKPERIFIPVGTDNLHVDNPNYTTTRGTPQTGQTDGSVWQLDVEAYVDLTVGMIELYAQIAPVTVVPIPGNHDKHTSMMMAVFLLKLYADRKDVNVVRNYDPRVYQQYGKNCFCFTHGDGMSLPKLKRDAHKFFMHEAGTQGIKDAVHYALFSGHLHFDHYEDLGVVKHFIIPSLSASDSWHKESGYVGSKEEASLYVFDKHLGRKVVLYS